MPGIFGFTHKKSIDDRVKTISGMQDLVSYKSFHVKDAIFTDDEVAASRVHINVIQKESQPFKRGGIFVWLDGEFYNSEIFKRENHAAMTDAELLFSLYNRDREMGFLKDLEGFYCAAIYDSSSRSIMLISDRYGLRHLYYAARNGEFAWASEVKTFFAIDGFDSLIDKRAVDNFLKYGQLLDEETYFNDIKLLKTGHYLKWDIDNRTLIEKRYWGFNDIKINESISIDDAVDKMGELFINSVKRCYGNGEGVGMMVSGGVDSRAILAAIPQNENKLNAVTFGKKGSDDVEISKRVAKVRDINHYIVELDEKNWLQSRIAPLWWADGQLVISDMHGAEALTRIKELFDISLNGLGGGALLGDAFFGDKHWNVIEKIHQRNRRFIVHGPKTGAVYFESRLPFISYKLVDHALSLPLKFRKNYLVYKKMMIARFPAYFKNIPWQHSGVPISWSETKLKRHKFYKRIKNKFFRELKRFGYDYDPYKNYLFADYNKWIREEPAKSFFAELLNVGGRYVKEFVAKEKIVGDLEDHFRGAPNYENLCKYITLELWFRQIFDKEYRT